MKEEELRKHASCSICGQPIGKTGSPLFWIVTVERHAVKLDAVRRQDGLAAFLGDNPLLAQVMGPDEELTERVLGPVKLTVCEDCALKDDVIAVAFHEADA